MLEDENAVKCSGNGGNKEVKDLLAKAIAKLPEKEKTVVYLLLL